MGVLRYKREANIVLGHVVGKEQCFPTMHGDRLVLLLDSSFLWGVRSHLSIILYFVVQGGALLCVQVVVCVLATMFSSMMGGDIAVENAGPWCN